MRVIITRLADSPAIEIWFLAGGFNYKFIANQDKKFKFNKPQTSANGHECQGNYSAFCYMRGDFKTNNKISENFLKIWYVCLSNAFSAKLTEIPDKICTGCDGERQGEYWVPKVKDDTCKPFSQGELSILIRELGLLKDGAELLASRLNERNMLSKRTKVSRYRNRDEPFGKYFTEEDDVV